MGTTRARVSIEVYSRLELNVIVVPQCKEPTPVDVGTDGDGMTIARYKYIIDTVIVTIEVMIMMMIIWEEIT